MEAQNAPVSGIVKYCQVAFTQIKDIREFANVWLVIFGHGACKRPVFVSKRKFPPIQKQKAKMIKVHPWDSGVIFIEMEDGSKWEVHQNGGFSYGTQCFRVDESVKEFSISWNPKREENNENVIHIALASSK